MLPCLTLTFFFPKRKKQSWSCELGKQVLAPTALTQRATCVTLLSTPRKFCWKHFFGDKVTEGQVCPNSLKSSGLETNTFKHTRQRKISNKNIALSSYETALHRLCYIFNNNNISVSCFPQVIFNEDLVKS